MGQMWTMETIPKNNSKSNDSHGTTSTNTTGIRREKKFCLFTYAWLRKNATAATLVATAPKLLNFYHLMTYIAIASHSTACACHASHYRATPYDCRLIFCTYTYKSTAKKSTIHQSLRRLCCNRTKFDICCIHKDDNSIYFSHYNVKGANAIAYTNVINTIERR
jgi:hypothetical protein